MMILEKVPAGVGCVVLLRGESIAGGVDESGGDEDEHLFGG
jgi:hypothetical protein